MGVEISPLCSALNDKTPGSGSHSHHGALNLSEPSKE
jgi:hypothetical protein